LKVRRPHVAGSFYERDAQNLRDQLKQCFLHKYGPGRLPEKTIKGARSLLALVCPHAGYVYSGPTAARSYLQLATDGKPECIIILGPNHTGLGSILSTNTEGAWSTPLGDVSIDSELAKTIVKESGIIDVEDYAHMNEHSIEVQLPFLQYLYGNEFSFVPICMMAQDLETSVELGKALAKCLERRDGVIIASSDMSHYEPHEEAVRRDKFAIDKILALDEVGLQRVVEEKNVSMCGYGPVTAAIRAAKELGANKAEFLGYSTSGDTSGDKSAVVGYLSAAIAH
jgi:hypothetical protein